MSVGPSLVAWRSRQDIQDVQDRQDILKIVALSVFLHLIILLTYPIFRTHPTSGDQNRVKHLLYPPFIYICCCLTWVLLTLNIILLEMKTFTLNYLRILIQLANKSQMWIYSTFHFQPKCCQKWCSYDNVSWFFYQLQF